MQKHHEMVVQKFAKIHESMQRSRQLGAGPDILSSARAQPVKTTSLGAHRTVRVAQRV